MLGVQPQVGVGALQGPGPELLHVLVKIAAHPADAILAHALDAELLNEPVDLARADAVEVGLHHHRHDRLLTAPTRLKNDGKYAGPDLVRGICSSISATWSPTPARDTR
jgi:hypothetical protein